MNKLIGILSFAVAVSVFSAEYYVDASRPDNFGAATNWSTAKQTIQAAVDRAAAGDTDWVTNGVYDAGGAEAPPYWEPFFGFIENALTNRICVTAPLRVCSVNGSGVTVIEGAEHIGVPICTAEQPCKDSPFSMEMLSWNMGKGLMMQAEGAVFLMLLC